MFQAQAAVHELVLEMNARQEQCDWRVSQIEEDLKKLKVCSHCYASAASREN